MAQENGVLREGARRVWKRQRIVWWFFFVNFLLSWVAAAPYSARLAGVTAHSLHSERLISGFDYSAYSELVSNPEVAHDARLPESGVAVLVYVVFALFLTGGVLETYAADRKLTTAEFFQACGAFFWRWFRLLILMSIIIVPLVMLSHFLFHESGKMILTTLNEKTGYWVGLLVFLLSTFVMMVVRLWFDMAQVRTVVDDERGMIRTALRAFKFTFSHFRSLFWLYFRISALAWLGLAAGLWLWSRISGQRSGLSFFVLEMVLLWWIGTRLWQRASETVWFMRYSVPSLTTPPVEPMQPQAPATLISGPVLTN
jgi:hypothetical protein